MAHTAYFANQSALGIVTLLAKPFTALGKGLVALGEANSRYQKLNALMELSDAELAKRNLKRDELVHHVFSDSYYI
ncbi:MAG: hypothetical protein BM560_12245 [Roseobacter sp. MedPE-SWde]|uniref:hypothetical protein n=1 Tax=Roseobacter sp. MED193 TaxID=314262 RepID=UPI000068B936|nr:hypothetical protein [Roseobacter sp. MED193]EAQ47001.1 hypothetical protein MED193_17449 [Roseobacter sp. MED193]OIQ40782.1 MAG: hypothetical protein BM560_12245 [Roseobacter sp. MedPE-SWde]